MKLVHGDFEEFMFWQDYIHSPESRLRAQQAFAVTDPILKQAITSIGRPVVRVVDVGSGPLTSVGRVCDDVAVDVTATDKLADFYNCILDRAGIEPPVRTMLCDYCDNAIGAPGTFDIAYARNSVDHSRDPLRVIDNMLTSVGEGGKVILRHAESEADKQKWTGLHQWNFILDGNTMRITGKEDSVTVAETFPGRGIKRHWVTREPSDALFPLVCVIEL